MSTMNNTQNENFKKVIYEAKAKFQWGVPQTINQNSNNLTNIVQDTNINGIQQSSQNNLKPKLNHNGLNFQDLPVKQSQIISNSHQQYQVKNTQNATFKQVNLSQQNKQTMQRLNQLKNQFEILRDMMIDSRILDGKQKNYDKISNLSKSNIGSISNHHVKTGEAIRAKDKISRKSQVSSSSLSNKNLDIKKKSHQKKKSSGLNYRLQNIQRDQSKISKSKHSQNPKSLNSKNPSRILQRQSSKVGGFYSNNMLQKHSLELQLRNSLEKIQNLLQNQIILKSRNHELQEALKASLKNTTETNNIQNPQFKKLRDINSELQLQIQKYRSQNRELIIRIGRLEAQSVSNQAMVQFLKQQKNKQSSYMMSMKLNQANLQIQNKRLQMQRNIQKRQYQFQYGRLKKQIQMLKSNPIIVQREVIVHNIHNIKNEVNHDIQQINYRAQKEKALTKQNEQKQIQQKQKQEKIKIRQQNNNLKDKQRIKQLQQLLDEKQKNHRQTIARLQAQIHHKQQTKLLQLVENLHKRKQQQGQSDLARQLGRLKQQLTKIKNRIDLTQSQYSQFGFQSKVVSLQQALQKDNQQRQRNYLELQKFQQQHQKLKLRYKESLVQKQQLDEALQRQNKLVNKYKTDFEEVESYKTSYEQINKNNEKLTLKIIEQQSIIRNYEALERQIAGLKQALRKKQSSHILQIKDARRRVDNAQFQAFKVQEESKINVDLNKRKLLSDIEVLNGQLKALEIDRNYYRDQISAIRQENQILSLKLKDYQFHRQNRYNTQAQHQVQQKQKIKHQHQQQLNAVNKKFMSEQQKLIDQIASLTKINEEMSEQIKKYVLLQTQNAELRALCKAKVSLDSSVLHLWDIKDIQYNNINQILKYIKSQQIKKLEESLFKQSKNIINREIVSQPIQENIQRQLISQPYPYPPYLIKNTLPVTQIIQPQTIQPFQMIKRQSQYIQVQQPPQVYRQVIQTNQLRQPPQILQMQPQPQTQTIINRIPQQFIYPKTFYSQNPNLIDNK